MLRQIPLRQSTGVKEQCHGNRRGAGVEEGEHREGVARRWPVADVSRAEALRAVRSPGKARPAVPAGPRSRSSPCSPSRGAAAPTRAREADRHPRRAPATWRRGACWIARPGGCRWPHPGPRRRPAARGLVWRRGRYSHGSSPVLPCCRCDTGETRNRSLPYDARAGARGQALCSLSLESGQRGDARSWNANPRGGAWAGSASVAPGNGGRVTWHISRSGPSRGSP